MSANPNQAVVMTEKGIIRKKLDTQELRTLWTNGLKEKYDQLLNENITSDIPPYKVINKLLRFLATNGLVLDVGSLSGINTGRLADEVEPRKVVGIDIFEKNVADANEKFEGRNDIEFIYVPEEAPIPSSLGEFDVAFAGFVIPTISEYNSLALLFQKVFESLKSGGTFTSLGLDPNSFHEGNEYRYYHHKLPPGGSFKDGNPFQNELESHAGHKVSFIDYCWTNETLYKLLRSAGFRNIRFIKLRRGAPGELVETLEGELNILDKQYDIEWGNEWDEGRNLYQIIMAEKPEFAEIEEEG